MTGYTFVPNSSASSVNWNDPAVWSGGVVPDGPTADVTIPTTDYVATGQLYVSFITIARSYSIDSLSLSNNYLVDSGSLSVANGLSIGTGGEIDLAGTLSAGSITNAGYDIQGSGQITAGTLLNDTEVVGGGLTLTADSLTNSGSLVAVSGGLTVTVSAGGFTNLSGSILTGGTYEAGYNGNDIPASNILYLNVGGVIVTDAADISLHGGGAIESYDNTSGTYVPITSSLDTIAASGDLALSDTTFDWGSLTVDGRLTLNQNGEFDGTELTVDPQGTVLGNGVIAGPVTDSGTILVDQSAANGTSGTSAYALDLTGPVSGSGVIEIGRANSYLQERGGGYIYTPASLELGAQDSTNVKFLDGRGTLILNDPSGFSGTIIPSNSGDQIELPGIALSSVSSYSYSGNTGGGTLTVDWTGGTVSLDFAGDFDKQSFSLSAGPQVLTSDPPSLLITDNGPVDFVRHNFRGDGLSDFLLQNSNGTLTVAEMSTGNLTYNAVGAVGPEWKVLGGGDFLGTSTTDVLFQNNNTGALVVGDPTAGTLAYTQIGGVGPEWQYGGAGDFLPGSGEDFLLHNTNSGALAVAAVTDGQAVYTQIGGGFGNQWAFEGTGDLLGDGHSAFALYNASSGAIVIGEIAGGEATYTQVGGVGNEWQFEGTGDFLGTGQDELLLWNANSGALVASQVTNGTETFTQISAIGPEWHFLGTGTFGNSGTQAGYVVENTSGAIVLGTVATAATAGHYTQIGQIGPEWSAKTGTPLA